MSKPRNKFSYKRRLQFYETDGMGIIHHANYLLLLEEARLQFLREVYAEKEDQTLLDETNYPLVSCHVDYKKPLHFNEEVTIEFNVSVEGVRLIFDYHFITKSFENPVAFGKTVHVAFDMKKQRAVRLPKRLIEFLKVPASLG